MMSPRLTQVEFEEVLDKYARANADWRWNVTCQVDDEFTQAAKTKRDDLLKILVEDRESLVAEIAAGQGGVTMATDIATALIARMQEWEEKERQEYVSEAASLAGRIQELEGTVFALRKALSNSLRVKQPQEPKAITDEALVKALRDLADAIIMRNQEV
jgi:hypothetical protein